MSAIPVKILEWTPEYSVHVPEIDREHQTWFSVTNRLHEAMLAGEGTRILATLLAEMTQYTLHHFANEEKLMAAVQYAGLRAHVRQHDDDLRRRAKAFGERFERGEAAITIELTLFLSEWIKQHTLTTDRQLGDAIMHRRIGRRVRSLSRRCSVPTSWQSKVVKCRCRIVPLAS
jgi:hemerythrin